MISRVFQASKYLTQSFGRKNLLFYSQEQQLSNDGKPYPMVYTIYQLFKYVQSHQNQIKNVHDLIPLIARIPKLPLEESDGYLSYIFYKFQQANLSVLSLKEFSILCYTLSFINYKVISRIRAIVFSANEYLHQLLTSEDTQLKGIELVRFFAFTQIVTTEDKTQNNKIICKILLQQIKTMSIHLLIMIISQKHKNIFRIQQKIIFNTIFKLMDQNYINFDLSVKIKIFSNIFSFNQEIYKIFKLKTKLYQDIKDNFMDLNEEDLNNLFHNNVRGNPFNHHLFSLINDHIEEDGQITMDVQVVLKTLRSFSKHYPLSYLFNKFKKKQQQAKSKFNKFIEKYCSVSPKLWIQLIRNNFFDRQSLKIISDIYQKKKINQKSSYYLYCLWQKRIKLSSYHEYIEFLEEKLTASQGLEDTNNLRITDYLLLKKLKEQNVHDETLNKLWNKSIQLLRKVEDIKKINSIAKYNERFLVQFHHNFSNCFIKNILNSMQKQTSLNLTPITFKPYQDYFFQVEEFHKFYLPPFTNSLVCRNISFKLYNFNKGFIEFSPRQVNFIIEKLLQNNNFLLVSFQFLITFLSDPKTHFLLEIDTISNFLLLCKRFAKESNPNFYSFMLDLFVFIMNSPRKQIRVNPNYIHLLKQSTHIFNQKTPNHIILKYTKNLIKYNVFTNDFKNYLIERNKFFYKNQIDSTNFTQQTEVNPNNIAFFLGSASQALIEKQKNTIVTIINYLNVENLQTIIHHYNLKLFKENAILQQIFELTLNRILNKLEGNHPIAINISSIIYKIDHLQADLPIQFYDNLCQLYSKYNPKSSITLKELINFLEHLRDKQIFENLNDHSKRTIKKFFEDLVYWRIQNTQPPYGLTLRIIQNYFWFDEKVSLKIFNAVVQKKKAWKARGFLEKVLSFSIFNNIILEQHSQVIESMLNSFRNNPGFKMDQKRYHSLIAIDNPKINLDNIEFMQSSDKKSLSKLNSTCFIFAAKEQSISIEDKTIHDMNIFVIGKNSKNILMICQFPFHQKVMDFMKKFAQKFIDADQTYQISVLFDRKRSKIICDQTLTSEDKTIINNLVQKAKKQRNHLRLKEKKQRKEEEEQQQLSQQLFHQQQQSLDQPSQKL